MISSFSYKDLSTDVEIIIIIIIIIKFHLVILMTEIRLTNIFAKGTKIISYHSSFNY